MLEGSYEEAHLVPTALNLSVDLTVRSYADASATVIGVSEAARQHFGGVFDEPRWSVDVGELNRVADVTLADGAKAVAMGLAAQRSAETGTVVDL